MNGIGKHLALLTAVAALVLFNNLGVPRLWDRDEPRNAGCAFEMLSRGDWVTPWFNDELRTHKPVLIYWFIMVAYSVFGVSEFSARMWSAVLGTGTVVLTYFIGRRLFNARAGLIAAIALASSLMFDVASRAATPDAYLVFFTTAALTVFIWRSFDSVGVCRISSVGFEMPITGAVAIYALMAVAVLAKGPVGIVLPTLILVLFVAIQKWSVRTNIAENRSRHWFHCLASLSPKNLWNAGWSLRPITALFIVAVVAVPWYLWVGLRTDGEFLRGFFLDHNLNRALEPREGHSGAIWFYPTVILVGFFPWSVFAVPTFLSMRAKSEPGPLRISPSVLFLICWVLVWVGVFSTAQTKLPSYVTPCYPALALLTARMLDRWISGAYFHQPRWIIGAFVVCGMVGAIYGVAIPIVTQRDLQGESWLAAFGTILIISSVASVILLRRGQRQGALNCFAAGAVLFCSCLLGWGSVAADRHQHSDILLSTVKSSNGPVNVYSYGCLEPSWVFYLRQPIRELTLDALNRNHSDQSNEFQPLPPVYIRDMEQAAEPVFVITTGTKLEQLQSQLDDSFEVVAEAPLFLKHERLVLLSRIIDHPK